jgi:D-sedoheptulose 7-phosphate isomerase
MHEDINLHRCGSKPSLKLNSDEALSNDRRIASEHIVGYFDRASAVMECAANSSSFLASVAAVANELARLFRNGNKILLAGNGGSAADAQHIAAEFLCRFGFDRAPLPAIALTTDSSVLTAVANDYSFEQVFERQVRGLGSPGDALLGISTSGLSKNVIAALKAARETGLVTIGFTGENRGEMHEMCDLTLSAPSSETAMIQQIHIVAAHAICGIVEHQLFGNAIRPATAA